jgi:hypothetical protein
MKVLLLKFAVRMYSIHYNQRQHPGIPFIMETGQLVAANGFLKSLL